MVVDNRVDFVAALQNVKVDLILSDNKLPSFDGLAALQISRELSPKVPFIFVSGSVGEERAVDLLQNGATDYVLKDRLSRLCPAVRLALDDVEGRAANRQTCEALRQSEELLQVIFSESPLGIALLGHDGGPVVTNLAYQHMLGYTGVELRKMPFLSFTHPDDCAKSREFHAQLTQGARRSYQLEKRYIRKDGQVVWARLSVSLTREAAGHPHFAIATVEDITECRSLQAQYIEAQKMEVVGQLAGGVAHDFNNILAVIIGYSDLMLGQTSLAGEFKTKLETIRAASERAAGLTRQLLVFSRKQAVQSMVLDVNDVVKDLDKLLLQLIDDNIEMKIVPGKQTGCVRGDSGYVGQVIMNLVVNARDAMPNGGKLTIATSNVTLDENYTGSHPGVIPGEYVMLSVSDTGTGMTDEVKTHLFEAFFTTKPKGKGTGLGLATCQTIVRQSGGHIGVYSELGNGTTFKVFFPRIEQPSDVAARQAQDSQLPRGTETLLIVEDEPSLKELICRVLEAQGYEVLSASNGKDALHVASNHKKGAIHLVISDVVMPLMSGKVMAEWLRASYPDLPILFTSGYTGDAIAQDGVLELGVEFLPKPNTPAVLARKVREMLDAASPTVLL
jgi:PAS domain S-box-containing protein